ncbi:MAG: hypothetical protein LBU12_02605 [Deltaproteobacteria bacterium]|jgi:hypothetical protein|nr:hypothetical protein [Deltaproteobacteria bacterium]
MTKSVETVDRVGALVLQAFDFVRQELAKQEDFDGEEMVDMIFLTIAVMGLCRQDPPDRVMDVLSAMRLKVERGDFHQGGDGVQGPPAVERLS